MLVTMENIRTSLEENGGRVDLASKDVTFDKSVTDINGDLILNGSIVNFLADELVIHGDLYLNNANINLLPDTIKVLGNLYASSSKSVLTCYRLNVSGNIVAERSIGFTVLDSLVVDGNATFTGSAIGWIPKGTIIGGNLDISEMPKGTSKISIDIRVDGDLICKNNDNLRTVIIDNIGGNIIKR